MKVSNIVIFTIFVRTTVFISRCCTWVAREIRFIRRMKGLESYLDTKYFVAKVFIILEYRKNEVVSQGCFLVIGPKLALGQPTNKFFPLRY